MTRKTLFDENDVDISGETALVVVLVDEIRNEDARGLL